MKINLSYKVDVKFKSFVMLSILAITPNLLGMINLPTVFGFKIHLFQYIVFIAAAIYGPVGGAISGSLGSMFSATAMSNPYIVVGNLILGVVAGALMKKGWGILPAVVVAYLIQIPWLYLTDICLIGMPHALVVKIMLGLLATNIIWAIAAKHSYKEVEKLTL